MIVVDASVLVSALADDGADGERARARLSGEALAAPQLIDLEVTSVLRRLTLGGQPAARRAAVALDDLVDLPIERAPHAPLVHGCWELRENVTAYVALAELLEVALVTSDHRLAQATGPRCSVELLTVE